MDEATNNGDGVWAKLGYAPSLLAAISLFVLMMMTFFDVILRSLLNNPIESATELTRLLMAITVFSALPIISWRNGHIVVDLLDPLFSPSTARVRNIIVDLVSGLCLIWPAYRIWELALRARQYGDTTEYLQIPQFYIAMFIAFSAMVTALVLLLRAGVGIFAPSKLPDRKQIASEMSID
ncbi:MAG: TRAP transporter small permease [Hyphomicrobiales bacterium]